MISFLQRLFGRPRPRDLIYVTYTEADRLLELGEGWRLAPEEDHNSNLGMVYLERDRPRAPR